MTTDIQRRRLLRGALAAAVAGFARPVFAQARKPVKFLFDVLPNPKHGLFYPAAKKGFFAAEGLDVTIESSKGSADVIQNVASGAAQFGFADASAVVLSRTRDLPVTLVAMVHYKTLMSVITRAPSGVEKPADLVGKKIASTSGDAVRMVMPAFAKMNGFDGEKVNFLTVNQPAKASMLMAGQVDGVCDYLSAMPIYREAGKAIGLELKAISYADYGLDIYSNGIIVHDDLLRSDPALVKSFARAIAQGLEFAASQRDETARIFREYQPQYSEAVTREGLDIAVDSLLVPEVFSGGIGAMSAGKMERTIKTTVEAYGLAKAPAAPSVYTNAMLPGIFPRKT
ncbi:NitT/TauT family transport system substrate-binding protein [Nitrobacteraceae bacterium AZCC 2161]